MNIENCEAMIFADAGVICDNVPPQTATHFRLEGWKVEVESVSVETNRLGRADEETIYGPESPVAIVETKTALGFVSYDIRLRPRYLRRIKS